MSDFECIFISVIIILGVLFILIKLGYLSPDSDIHRLSRNRWLTDDPRERYYIRRDAANVLANSKRPHARRFAIGCLMEKQNIIVLDTCLEEIEAGFHDNDRLTARKCALFFYNCVSHGINLSRGQYITGVAVDLSDAIKYNLVVTKAMDNGIGDPIVARILNQCKANLEAYIRDYTDVKKQ